MPAAWAVQGMLELHTEMNGKTPLWSASLRAQQTHPTPSVLGRQRFHLAGQQVLAEQRPQCWQKPGLQKCLTARLSTVSQHLRKRKAINTTMVLYIYSFLVLKDNIFRQL